MKLQFNLQSQNCQSKEDILEAIHHLRSDSLFKDSSEYDVSDILTKMSAMASTLEEIAAKNNLNTQK